MRMQRPARAGMTAVESAVVFPLTLLMIIGVVVGGLGVFRYQEVSHLAREATRYASTHGGQYQIDGMPAKTGVPAVLSNSDIQAYLSARAVGLDPSRDPTTELPMSCCMLEAISCTNTGRPV